MMAFNNFSILLLIEIFYIPSAVLLSSEHSAFYADWEKAFDKTSEIQNKPAETSEYGSINSPILRLQEFFFRENQQQDEHSIIPKPLVRRFSDPKRAAESFYKRSKNPPKSNPLCFFSALPCTPRRKGVYYVPRKF